MRPPSPIRSRRRITVAAAGLAALTLLATGCSAEPVETSEPVQGGILVYATGDAEPSCLDPHVGGNYPQALLATQYLESLVSKNSAGDIIPWLATEWSEAENGLSWEFTLRDDVMFTDGTPLNAEAVQANVEHLLDPATASSTGYLALGKVASTEIVDEFTIRFVLSSADSSLLDSLSMPWLAIQSPTALERSQEANCESPVGTGPFVVTQWAKQESVVLDRNEEYHSPPADADHDGPAWLDQIIWRFIPDPASRYSALQGGQVDVIDNPQPSDIAAAASIDTITELDAPRPGASNRIELNAGKAPFNDVKVREAFIRAADVNDGIESLFFGTADRSYSLLSSAESLGVAGEEHFAVDLEEANALLDSAGWAERDSEGYRTKDGERLSLDFPVSTNQSIPAEQSLFEQIQATVKAAGFEILLRPMDLSSWYGVLGAGEYDLVSAPYTKVGPDVLRILFHSDSITPAPSGYFANHSQVNDPEVDSLLTQASQVSDPEQRAALYEQVQQKILAGFYVLPLYDQQNHFLVGGAVNGLRAMPTVSTPTFYDVWLAR
jgi:peptide/nickel transport system substrate-binding protein